MSDQREEQQNLWEALKPAYEIEVLIDGQIYGIISEMARAQGTTVKSWCRQALRAQVEADLDSPEELGRLFSEHLKQVYHYEQEKQ